MHQGQAVGLALEHGQAVVVRANAPGKNGVAVIQQMVGGDGGRSKAVCALHILRCLCGGDVLKHHFEFG